MGTLVSGSMVGRGTVLPVEVIFTVWHRRPVENTRTY